MKDGEPAWAWVWCIFKHSSRFFSRSRSKSSLVQFHCEYVATYGTWPRVGVISLRGLRLPDITWPSLVSQCPTPIYASYLSRASFHHGPRAVGCVPLPLRRRSCRWPSTLYHQLQLNPVRSSAAWKRCVTIDEIRDRHCYLRPISQSQKVCNYKDNLCNYKKILILFSQYLSIFKFVNWMYKIQIFSHVFRCK